MNGGVKRPSGGALHASATRWPLQVLRSSQLDAERLDHELVSMLHEQFMKVFAHCQQVGSGGQQGRAEGRHAEQWAWVSAGQVVRKAC